MAIASTILKLLSNKKTLSTLVVVASSGADIARAARDIAKRFSGRQPQARGRDGSTDLHGAYDDLEKRIAAIESSLESQAAVLSNIAGQFQQLSDTMPSLARRVGVTLWLVLAATIIATAALVVAIAR